jgi:chemotaxis protein methyltransferase CheR
MTAYRNRSRPGKGVTGMQDDECVRFLQWALPRLGLRWPGFRRVRGQVCKRILRRVRALQLENLEAYRDHLHDYPAEWEVLDRFCRITISRFYRDRWVFDALGQTILPRLIDEASARGDDRISCWCIGCAAGEEAYTLSLMWVHLLAGDRPAVDLRIVATDASAKQLERARAAVYPASSLKELSPQWRRLSFTRDGRSYRLHPRHSSRVDFRQQDIRTEVPPERFQLILCRNLVFTYYDNELQRAIAGRIRECLLPRGALVLGAHEALPEGVVGFSPCGPKGVIYVRID